MTNNIFYKKGDKVHVILGNAVVTCKIETNEKLGDKHLKINFNNKIFFKQKSYCYQLEIQALDNLKERLEKSLTIINTRINQLITKEMLGKTYYGGNR
jgi:hypothetical protein